MNEFLKLKTVRAGPRRARYRKRDHVHITSAGMGAQQDDEAHDKHHVYSPEPQAETWPRRLMRWIRNSGTL